MAAIAIAPDSTERVMSAREMDTHDRAAALRYQDQPCRCRDCGRAGVDNQPRRFVPTERGDAYEHAWNARRNQREVIGHWAHGEELAAWYRARDAFFGRLARRVGRGEDG